MAQDLPVGSQPTLSIATAIKPPSFYQQPDQAQQAQLQATSSSGAAATAQPETVARGQAQAQNSNSKGTAQPQSGTGNAASRASRESRNSSWQQADPGMEEMRRLLSPWRYVPWWHSVHISSQIHRLVGPGHSRQQVPGTRNLAGCCCLEGRHMP